MGNMHLHHTCIVEQISRVYIRMSIHCSIICPNAKYLRTCATLEDSHPSLSLSLSLSLFLSLSLSACFPYFPIPLKNVSWWIAYVCFGLFSTFVNPCGIQVSSRVERMSSPALLSLSICKGEQEEDYLVSLSRETQSRPALLILSGEKARDRDGRHRFDIECIDILDLIYRYIISSYGVRWYSVYRYFLMWYHVILDIFESD